MALEAVRQAVGGSAKAVAGGYCRLHMPLKLALAVRGTVAEHRLGALEWGGGVSAPPSNASLAVGHGCAARRPPAPARPSPRVQDILMYQHNGLFASALSLIFRLGMKRSELTALLQEVQLVTSPVVLTFYRQACDHAVRLQNFFRNKSNLRGTWHEKLQKEVTSACVHGWGRVCLRSWRLPKGGWEVGWRLAGGYLEVGW